MKKKSENHKQHTNTSSGLALCVTFSERAIRVVVVESGRQSSSSASLGPDRRLREKTLSSLQPVEVKKLPTNMIRAGKIFGAFAERLRSSSPLVLSLLMQIRLSSNMVNSRTNTDESYDEGKESEFHE